MTLAENNNNAFVPLRLASVKAGDGSPMPLPPTLSVSSDFNPSLFFFRSFSLLSIYYLFLFFFFTIRTSHAETYGESRARGGQNVSTIDTIAIRSRNL